MFLWTSEAVSRGHPDKVADQLADTILDAYLDGDNESRVACEVVCCKGFVLVTGEITSKSKPDIDSLIRAKLKEIGYDRDEHGFNCNNVEIMNRINKQSPQIAKAVSKDDGSLGSGDQGCMFGMATTETKEYMPLAHTLSFKLIDALRYDVESKREGDSWGSPLLPDAKSQITLEYHNNKPKRVHTVVISTQHKSNYNLDQIRKYVKGLVSSDLATSEYHKYFDEDTKWLINPAGEWNIGGPEADTGLSGRKIVVDNFGADCPIGGGSFSGKDATKVDRSGAYAARWLAKNIVAQRTVENAQVQIAYAIGVSQPVSLRVKTNNGEFSIDYLIEDGDVDLSPQGIINKFGLRTRNGWRYQDTAYGGHFGRNIFPWEKLDLFHESCYKDD